METKADDLIFGYGLTKREYFAAAALQGLLAHTPSDKTKKQIYEHIEKNETSLYDLYAELALKASDALIEELNRKVSNK